MPNLRAGEYMSRCLNPTHSSYRSQKYYIARTYYNLVERFICQGCCRILGSYSFSPLVYEGVDGYKIQDLDHLLERVPKLQEKGFKDMLDYVCGFYAVNKKHCYINGRCVVCKEAEL